MLNQRTKLTLEKLQVKSFVTALDRQMQATIKGREAAGPPNHQQGATMVGENCTTTG